MADYTELELKTFDLSSRDSDLSLSVTSLALISDLPSPQQSSEELCQLIQSKQLWLVSPGVCRIQIIVRQNQLSLSSDGIEVGFLEHLADVICQCSIWPSLGLTIRQEDIHYQPLYNGAPNLYFIVEHTQKSSVLLSPTHNPTARFNGIECLFCYNSDTPGASQVDTEQADAQDTNISTYFPGAVSEFEAIDSTNPYEDEISGDYWNDPIPDVPLNQARQRWNDAAYLAQMALQITIGVKERIRGLRIVHLDAQPSLLQLAPAIWNGHYLKAMTFHVAKFPIISNIIATVSRGRSPALRRKSIKLLIGSDEEGAGAEIDINIYRNSIHKRLWNLVQTELEPTIRMKDTTKSLYPQWSETTNEAFDFIPAEFEGLDEYESGVPINMDGSHGTVFHDAVEDGQPFYGYLGHEIWDNDIEFDDTAEYQQYWENEGVRFIDEELPMEDTDVVKQEDEAIYPPDFSLHASYPNWYSSDIGAPDETTTDEQFIAEGFSHPGMAVDEPARLYDVDSIYITTNELPFSPEAELWDELQEEAAYRSGGSHFIVLDERLADENYWPNEQVDQVVEVYE
ncbi:hypothetical protein F5Y06DRAFT_307442 [Hypoxylon sp. FL0890]|nr:hypothetical protein F5Y06DRAFT_307442 [Hypoxylon sp. FL0890]